jgi:hypothetical protein
MLRLTDAELDCVHRLAWPLLPQDRGPFLEAVAAALQQERMLGDGVVYRGAMQVQRRFWTPPTVDGDGGTPRRLTHRKYRRPDLRVQDRLAEGSDQFFLCPLANVGRA